MATHHFESIQEALDGRDEIEDGDVVLARNEEGWWVGGVMVSGQIFSAQTLTPGETFEPAGALARAGFSYDAAFQTAASYAGRENTLRHQLNRQSWLCAKSGRPIRPGDPIVRIFDGTGIALASEYSFPAPPAAPARVTLVCACGSAGDVEVDVTVAANVDLTPSCCGAVMRPALTEAEVAADNRRDG